MEQDMDPNKDSPLDYWANKHMSIQSTQSVDILDAFPPPMPHTNNKALPPIPDEFDFKDTPKRQLKTPPPRASGPDRDLSVMRAPPTPFNFNSLNDHLKMAIYQLEAGTDQWAKVHIDHAVAKQSPIGILLQDVGVKVGWWPCPHKHTKLFAHIDKVSIIELQAFAAEPAPRLAEALSRCAQDYPSLSTAALALNTPPSAPSTPLARTHSRSNSSHSVGSHIFPYPWRHSRNSSQASLK